MTTKKMTAPQIAKASDGTAKLLRQYGCGPIEFSGTDEALYERHLVFDHAVKVEAATARERFEALARSVRDVLTQTLAVDGGHLPAGKPQACLLLVDGVSHRPLAGEQRHEPPARSPRQASDQAEGPRLARSSRTGAARRSGKRCPR